MKKYILSILFFGCVAINSQTRKNELNILTFQEVEKLHKKVPKPVVVFIYTDWCSICHGMKQTTFKNRDVINKLNKAFYFIMLNAESKTDIRFLGKQFSYKPSGVTTGVHQLAKELATIKDKISYPTTTILSKNFEIEVQINSYLNSKGMNRLLKKYIRFQK